MDYRQSRRATPDQRYEQCQQPGENRRGNKCPHESCQQVQPLPPNPLPNGTRRRERRRKMHDIHGISVCCSMVGAFFAPLHFPPAPARWVSSRVCLSNAHLRCTPLDPRIRLIVPLSCASSAQSDNHGDAHAKTGAPSFCRPRTIAELWWLLRVVRKENAGLTVCHDLPLIQDLLGGGWRGNPSNRFKVSSANTDATTARMRVLRSAVDLL